MVIENLGRFTPAELRAGGINHRGLLQPLLPLSVQPSLGDEDSPFLLGQDGERVEPTGPLAELLRMAAVARTVVVVEQPGQALPHFLFGRIGQTIHVLDLRPDGSEETYLAQLSTKVEAAVEVAARLPGGHHLDDGDGGLSGPPRGHHVEDGDGPPSAPPSAAFISGGEANTLATITATSIYDPDKPWLQQRLTVASDQGQVWLVLGTRFGEEVGWSAAPPSAGRMEKLVAAMLHGMPAVL